MGTLTFWTTGSFNWHVWKYQIQRQISTALLSFEHCIKETSASHNFFSIWLCVPFYILVPIHNTVGLIASTITFILVRTDAFDYRSASKRHTHTSKNEPFRIIILIILMETVSKSRYPQLFNVSVSELYHIFCWIMTFKIKINQINKLLAFAHNCNGITWLLIFFIKDRWTQLVLRRVSPFVTSITFIVMDKWLPLMVREQSNLKA